MTTRDVHLPAPVAGETPAATARPRRGRLIALQAVYVLFLPVWLALAVAATMGLANTPEWWSPLLLLWTWAYPLVALAAIVLSHTLLTRRPRAARSCNLLPLPWVVLGCALLIWIFTADGFGP